MGTELQDTKQKHQKNKNKNLTIPHLTVPKQRYGLFWVFFVEAKTHRTLAELQSSPHEPESEFLCNGNHPIQSPKSEREKTLS